MARNHTWMLEVISDLEIYSVGEHMQELAEKLREARNLLKLSQDFYDADRKLDSANNKNSSNVVSIGISRFDY